MEVQDLSTQADQTILQETIREDISAWQCAYAATAKVQLVP